MKTLTGLSQPELLMLSPTMAEKASYDVVECLTNDISIIQDKKQCTWALQKLAYLAKDKITFSWNIDRQEDHCASLIGCGKPHFRKLNNLWTSTGLFIERVMNDFGYNIIENHSEEGGTEIITAKRMPHFKLREGTHPYDYPYHSVVTVPLDYEYFIWLYHHIDLKDAKTPGGWGKTQECLAYLRDFTDWKYNPIWWCKTLKKRIGGVHRSWMAPRLGRDSIEVMVMRVWWRREDAVFDASLLYDWGWKKYTN